MDYEKKYKEAIERLKQWDREHPNGYSIQERDEFIFPELKESGDERIRKTLMAVVNLYYGKGEDEEKTACLYWLEKQGRQKPAEWSEEDEKILSDIIKDLVHPWNEYIPDRIEDEIKWLKNRLKSLRPQNRWKPSDEHIEALEHFVRSIGESGYASPYDNNTKLLYSLLEQLKKLKG